MKRNGVLLLGGAMAAVAAGEVALHWLIGRGGFAGGALAIYVAADSGGKHFCAGIVDNFLPSVALGCVNGWVGFFRWSSRTLWVTTAGVAALVVALLPVYSFFIGSQRFTPVWGSLRSPSAYVIPSLSAFVITGFFTRMVYGGLRNTKRGDHRQNV